MKKNEIFTTQVIPSVPRSAFDLSHDVKLSGKMGYLYPVLCEEVLPGDTWRMTQEILGRVQPLLAPVMQRFNVLVEAYFVPSRILWKDYEFWQFQQNDLTDDDYPRLKLSAAVDNSIYGVGSLLDHLGGVPVQYDEDTSNWSPSYNVDSLSDNRLNALPFAAYQRIWYEYYRDQNIVDADRDENEFAWCRDSLPNGQLSNTIPNSQQFQGLMKLRKRAWKKDYFTSALPFAQKGDSVQIPLSFDNAIVGDGLFTLKPSIAPPSPAADILTWKTLGLDTSKAKLVDYGHASREFSYDSGLGIDSQAVDGTINELRTAFQVQKWLELNAVGGTRYVEALQKHFGASPRDSRLQRPELIGMSSAPFVISEVLQTTPTQIVDDQPEGALGDFAGHGISAKRHKFFKYQAEEFGYVVVLLSVMPEASYFQGVKKMLFKKSVFDFAFPSFAHLGEQEIQVRELVYPAPAEFEVFGYTPRYAEYKFINSRVAGQFRTTLNFWHYARILSGVLALNEQFLYYSNDKRIFAVDDQDEDELILHVNHNIVVSRPLPKYGTPLSLT